MNRKRIEAAIELMRETPEEQFDMENWQNCPEIFGNVVDTLEELHTCGNTTCFAGRLVLSPQWKEAGFSSFHGVPKDPETGSLGETAVIKYFEAETGEQYKFIQSIIFGDTWDYVDLPGNRDIKPDHPDWGKEWSLFYGKFWTDVTPQDVIVKLEQLLEMDQ